ncbi:alpha/beta fold hydrolase [Nocardia cyriacigeorgica]
MDALGGRYRMIAPDYPGFGYTEVTDGFVYSFDRLTDIIEGFVESLGLARFVLYAFDFGGPVGMRLGHQASQLDRRSGHPERQRLRRRPIRYGAGHGRQPTGCSGRRGEHSANSRTPGHPRPIRGRRHGPGAHRARRLDLGPAFP